MVEEKDGSGEGGGFGAEDCGAEAEGGETGVEGELGFFAGESSFGADESERGCRSLRVSIAEKIRERLRLFAFPEKKFQVGAGIFETGSETLRLRDGRRGGTPALFGGFDQ